MPDIHAPRAVLFDVEGVIAVPNVAVADAGLGKIAPHLNLSRLHAARNTPANYVLWQRYSVGALESGPYWEAALRTAGVRDPAAAVPAVQAVMREAWWGILNDAVLAYALRLRGSGSRIGLLSNSAPEHEPRIKDFGGEFDVQEFSHRTGRRKPDPEAYVEAARALRTPPDQCLFIDDKERNVSAARAVGMRAVRFTSWNGLLNALDDLALEPEPEARSGSSAADGLPPGPLS